MVFNSEWISMNGTKGKQLEASGSTLVLVTPEKQIFFLPISKEGPFGGKAQLIDGTLTQIDVGDGKIVGTDGKLGYYRLGITPDNWKGTDWNWFGSENIIYVAIGDGKIMGVRNDSKVVARSGVTTATPHGSSWIDIGGYFKQISIGDGKILGVNKINQVFYRYGIDHDNIYGVEWKVLDGVRLKQVDVGYGRIVGVDVSGHVWQRWGITFSQPFGKGWKMTTAGFFQHISSGKGVLFGIDKKGDIYICHEKNFPNN